VRDDLVPQMAAAEEVVAAADRGGAALAGLVLNERGYERFAATGLDRLNLTLAATETFNRRNANASLDEAVERVTAILARAGVPTTVTVSCAFGCPFEGEVDPAVVADLCERLSAAGELVLADTIGVAPPGSGSSAVPSGSTGTTRATRATRPRGARSRAARRCSTRRSAGSAAVRFLRRQQATSRRRTSSGSSSAKASPPE
jgi:hypothetical protein